MSVMSAIDGAIERARASASRLEQAHKHSIRTGEGREAQRLAAEKAQAIVAELLETRGSMAELIEATSHAECGCTVAERDSGHLVGCWMPNLSAALARWHGGAA